MLHPVFKPTCYQSEAILRCSDNIEIVLVDGIDLFLKSTHVLIRTKRQSQPRHCHRSSTTLIWMLRGLASSPTLGGSTRLSQYSRPLKSLQKRRIVDHYSNSIINLIDASGLLIKKHGCKICATEQVNYLIAKNNY